MLRRLSMGTALNYILFPFHEEDRVSPDTKTAQSVFDSPSDETGMERLWLMFTTDEFGTLSPELHFVYQATFLGLFTGACYGGYVRSRVAYLDFMQRNEATVFRNHFEAKKKLQDQVTVNFAKGAFQWGWRLGLFSGSYVLITTTISVYRGKSSLLEYTTAGALTGACYKCNMGLRGMLVGGLLGGALGTAAGAVSLAFLKFTGMTMEEVRFWQYRWKEDRLKHTNKAVKEEKLSQDPLLLQHVKKLEAKLKEAETVQTKDADSNVNAK